MFYYPFNPTYLWRQQLEENTVILDFKNGDVTGDGISDDIYIYFLIHSGNSLLKGLTPYFS